MCEVDTRRQPVPVDPTITFESANSVIFQAKTVAGRSKHFGQSRLLIMANILCVELSWGHLGILY